MADPIPRRVFEAEQRTEFREMLAASSLGDPDVQAATAQGRRVSEALPDRWMRVADLPGLLGMYRDRREVWREDHSAALAYVLCEVDYEPSQDDLSGGLVSSD